MRRAARTDDNHEAIVSALRKAGCLVQSLAAVGKGVPDLLVLAPKRFFPPSLSGPSHLPERLVLLEVKDGAKPPSARKLTPDELRFQEAGWPVVVVESVEDALRAVGVIS